MTEKTFRNMLPLTDEQREFLGDSNNNIRCSRCFLSANRVGNTLCGDFVNGKMWVDFTCSDVRAAALRLDDEYRKANMKKDILSQEEFASLPGCEINGYSPWWEAACKSHVALLDTVADLKKLYAMRKDKIYELEKEIEGGSDKIRELSFERAELTVKLEEREKSHAAALERIAELEAREKHLEDGWRNAEFRYDEQIAELEKENRNITQNRDYWENSCGLMLTEHKEQIADLEYAVKAWKELNIVNAKIKNDLRKEKIELHNKWNGQVNQNHGLTDKIAELESRLAEYEDEIKRGDK